MDVRLKEYIENKIREFEAKEQAIEEAKQQWMNEMLINYGINKVEAKLEELSNLVDKAREIESKIEDLIHLIVPALVGKTRTIIECPPYEYYPPYKYTIKEDGIFYFKHRSRIDFLDGFDNRPLRQVIEELNQTLDREKQSILNVMHSSVAKIMKEREVLETYETTLGKVRVKSSIQSLYVYIREGGEVECIIFAKYYPKYEQIRILPVIKEVLESLSRHCKKVQEYLNLLIQMQTEIEHKAGKYLATVIL